MENYQLHAKQEYESDDPIQDLIDNDMKRTKVMKLLENGENIKIIVIHLFLKVVTMRQDLSLNFQTII